MKYIISFLSKFAFIFILLYLYFLKINLDVRDIKVALCTMGRMEHLYIQEFIEYLYMMIIHLELNHFQKA